AKLYWKSDQKWNAWWLLGALLLLLLGYTITNVLFNRQSGEFTSALAARDADRFWHAVRMFSILLVVAVPVHAYYYYVRDKLSMQGRQKMPGHSLTQYFGGHSFYKSGAEPEIDNPDQRIAEDIRSFTAQSLTFFLLFASAAFELVAFSSVLWSISRLLVVI